MNGNRPDMEKRAYWQRILAEAARSGMSIGGFCRQRRLKETQFYWWQRTLKGAGQQGRGERPEPRGRESFALVSEEAGTMAAGLELVLRDGRRLRIGAGVEEESLRAVLAALEPDGHR
jgi:hypothetical protein